MLALQKLIGKYFVMRYKIVLTPAYINFKRNSFITVPIDAQKTKILLSYIIDIQYSIYTVFCTDNQKIAVFFRPWQEFKGF